MLDRLQRAAFDVLGGGDAGGRLDAAIGKARDRPRARIGIWERDQPRHLVRMLWNGVVGDLGDEAERSLRADDQVHQDIYQVMDVGQRIDRIADRVLELVLLLDQRN